MTAGKFVESVKVGDKIRVDGFARYEPHPDERKEYFQFTGAGTYVVGEFDGRLVRFESEGAVYTVHLRNIVEITECGSGNHVWDLSFRHCTRCGKKEEPKPEPGTWQNRLTPQHEWENCDLSPTGGCSRINPLWAKAKDEHRVYRASEGWSKDTRKGERRKARGGLEHRRQNTAELNGVLLRVLFKPQVPLSWADFTQRGTLPDRRKK